MRPPASILIVEDEEILAGNLKSYLGRLTPDVRVASDTARAMELLKFFSPEVVVLDYAWPNIDGLCAYSEIVRDRRQKPGYVMISGHMTDREAEFAHQRGIRHVLCKPFSLAELQQMVNTSAQEARAGGEDLAQTDSPEPASQSPQTSLRPAESGASGVDAVANRRLAERRQSARRSA